MVPSSSRRGPPFCASKSPARVSLAHRAPNNFNTHPEPPTLELTSCIGGRPVAHHVGTNQRNTRPNPAHALRQSVHERGGGDGPGTSTDLHQHQHQRTPRLLVRFVRTRWRFGSERSVYSDPFGVDEFVGVSNRRKGFFFAGADWRTTFRLKWKMAI